MIPFHANPVCIFVHMLVSLPLAFLLQPQAVDIAETCAACHTDKVDETVPLLLNQQISVFQEATSAEYIMWRQEK